MEILNDIHKAYHKYNLLIKQLEQELYPYLCEYLEFAQPQIHIREDEGCKLFIVDGINIFELDKERIDFIKKHKKINNNSDIL